MTFGDVLRNLLDEKDMTQKQLAKTLHMAASTLGSYIQNVSEPDFDTLKHIADYFGVTTDYLLGHRAKQAASQQEDELLRVFRALSKSQQEIFVRQGKAFLIQNGK